jgi:salicylate hydroxylase
MRKADQPEGVFIDNIKMKGKLSAKNSYPVLADKSLIGGASRFHRAELLGALHEQAMGQIHLSHRFVSFEEVGNKVVIQFDNGNTATCDILIGVDGIHSTVRKRFLDKQGLFKSRSYNPYWSGAYAYRGLISVEELERAFPGHLSCKQPMMVSRESM